MGHHDTSVDGITWSSRPSRGSGLPSSDPVATATTLFLLLTTIAIVVGLFVHGILLLRDTRHETLLTSVVAQAVLTTFIVVALLYSEGRDRPDPFAQVTNLLNATRAMIVVGVILPVSVSGMLNTAPNTGTYVRVVIGLGLAIAILWNLSEPETKQRKDSVS